MAKGINARALVKKQGTYGAGTTFATSGMYEYPFTSEGFDVAIDEVASANLSNSRAESTLLFNGKKAVGSIAGDMLYTRTDHLLAGIMGLPSTVVGAAGDVGAFTNTYTPLTTTPPMFDWAINKGNIPSAHPYYSFSGMKEKKLVISWKDKGPVSFAADYTGYLEISNTAGADAPTSDVTLVKDPILCGSNMTVIDVGTGASLAYCVKGATITLEQPLSEDDFCNGSDTPSEPDLDGFLQVTGELLVKFTDRLLYNDFLARTDLTAEFKFVSTSLVVAGTGTLFRTLDILINKMRYTKALVLVDTPGLLIARVGFKAYGDAGSGSTSQPIAFKTINEVKGDTAL